MPEHAGAEPEHPEHALSQPAHYNIKPIWPSVCPGYSFLAVFYPGARFYCLAESLPEPILDPSCQIARD
jgi:hypothetical protein